MSSENDSHDSGGIDGAAGELAKSALGPAAKEIGHALKSSGKTIGKIAAGTIDMALSPASIMVWGWEKIKEKVIESVQEKLEGVPEDELVKPDIHIVGPALMAMSFCAHEDDLREMFANLLAASMKLANKDKVHPSFVETIKQLQPDEAKILRYMGRTRDTQIPVADVIMSLRGWQNSILYENASQICNLSECELLGNDGVYLENLTHLGLLTRPLGQKLCYKEKYDWVNHHIYNGFTKDGCGHKWEYGFFRLTNYGKRFIETCVDSELDQWGSMGEWNIRQEYK